jgi:putative membrane protein
VTSAVLAVLAAASLGYLLAARRTAWSPRRTLSWPLGLGCVALAAAGPPAHAHGDLRAHMAGHLLAGMVAPVLLVLAAPVRLALRTLPHRRARTLARLLRTAPVRVLTEPFVATALDVGGLWLLYRTDLAGTVLHDPRLHLAMTLHVLLTGWLAAAAVLAVAPAPHRRSHIARALALAAGMAAHDVLAKTLYADPPAGVHDAAAGAQLMYHAGTAVHVVVAGLLWGQWYRSRAALRPVAVAGPGRRPGERLPAVGQPR